MAGELQFKGQVRSKGWLSCIRSAAADGNANPSSVLGPTMFVQIESVRRPSKRKRSPSVERERERENIPVATRSASKGSRVLSFQVPRISQAQKKLLEHETALKQKEKDIKRREADVDKKLETMRQVEFVIDKSESALASVRKELLEFVDLHIIPGAEASLQRLEADFTCPL